MKAMMRRISIAAGVALAAVPALLACNRTAAEEQPGSEWAVVERRDMQVRAEAAGAIEPIRLVEVKSKASGEVVRLHVESGDEVERGALLVEIDPRDVRNGFNQAEADLAVAEASLSTAVAQTARVKELLEANVATQQEYETAALSEANARASRIKAETNLELARERLEDVTIRAPISGTIIARGTIDETGRIDEIEEGAIIASASQNVSGGTVLITMADLSEMQLRALVDETDLGRINAGQVATVTVDAYRDREFEGEVIKIEPQAVVDENVTMFPVLVHLDNSERLLKPGMNADVVFEVAERTDVVAVPNAAIINVADAVAAGELLGIGEDAVNDALSGAVRFAGGPAVRAPDDAAGDEAAGGETESSAGETGAANGGPTPANDCEALRQSVRGRGRGAFQSMSEADRAKLRECFPQMGGGRFVVGRRGSDGPGGPGSAELGGPEGEDGFEGRQRRYSSEPEIRPAVVFVADAAGGPEARQIMIGLNDFDYTEVINGLEPGERVILMSIARLQAQQQEFTDRIRERNSGPLGNGR